MGDNRRVVESELDGVGAVVLAAGSSSRMGTPKQLLVFRGQTLLRRAALAALGAGCRPVIVVTGAHAGLTRRELNGLDVLEASNADWETGMASSIRAGLEALSEASPEATAAVLLLCDQPYVTDETVAALVAAHRATGKPIVASRYGESFGVPALFARPLFAELSELEGAAGAKPVIQRHAAETHFVTFEGGRIDVDTPDDFSRLASSPAAQ